MGFPGGSVGKESACDAGDTGEAGQSLSWEDPLEKGRATYSSILAWRIPWTEEPAGYSPWGRKESYMTEVTEHAYYSKAPQVSSSLLW